MVPDPPGKSQVAIDFLNSGTDHPCEVIGPVQLSLGGGPYGPCEIC